MSDQERFSIAKLVHKLRPRLVVELGTGDGFTASTIMRVLLPDSRLITVNWPNPPSGDNPNRYLSEYLTDQRLTIIYGDTRDDAVIQAIPDGINILHIDSTHTYDCASAEWNLYRPKMSNGGTVVVDDLNHNDMERFWDELPYDKTKVSFGRIGLFIFNRDKYP